MARAVTVGDGWRPYIKPSLKGRLVIRKRNTRFSPETEAKFWANQWGRMASIKPAMACKGLRMHNNSFQRCLREQLGGRRRGGPG